MAEDRDKENESNLKNNGLEDMELQKPKSGSENAPNSTPPSNDENSQQK